MVNGSVDTIALQGPLAAMWRDVYRKAGAVAEARTTELLRHHTYAYPHTLDHTHPSTTTFRYRFSTNTTMADPGAGVFRTNAATFAGSTAIALDALTDGGADVSSALAALAAGDTLFLQTEASSANWARYTVDAPATDQTGWWQLAVTPVAGGGTIPSNNTPCLIQLTLATGGGGGGGEDTGPWVDEAGDTMTGPLILQGATAAANVVQAKLAADTEARFRADAGGALEWGPGGITPRDVRLSRTGPARIELLGHLRPDATNAYDLGETGTPRVWRQVAAGRLEVYDAAGYLRVGDVASPSAATGAVRLKRVHVIAWRNTTDTADNTLGVDAGDQLVYNGVPVGGGGGGGTGNTTMYTQTGTPTGATNSLWFNPSESA